MELRGILRGHLPDLSLLKSEGMVAISHFAQYVL